MRRAPRPLHLLLFLSIVLTAGFTAAGRAQPAPPPPDAPDASDVHGRTAYAPTRERSRTTLARELREADGEFAARQQALRARLAAANGAERVLLLRELEALRRARPARLAEVQLAHARRTGNTAVAARLERRLATLRAAGVHTGNAGGGR